LKRWRSLKPKIEGIKQVTEENGKRYYITPEGNHYFSATTMLSVMDDGGIDSWRKSVGEEEASKIVADACNRGNMLHKACEDYLLDPDFDMMKLDTRIGPLFNRIRRHLKDVSNIQGIEYTLYSDKIESAGTSDLVGFHKSDLSIIDYKGSRTLGSNSKWGKKKMFKYLVQCGFYGLMWAELYGDVPTHALVLMASESDCGIKAQKVPIEGFMREAERVSLAYRGLLDPKELAYFKLFK
jgi:hypothetical protein